MKNNNLQDKRFIVV